LSWFEPLVEIRAFLFCESILSELFLPSECVTPCLHDLLEFRRAQRVPRFADFLAFVLIAFSVSSEFQQFESEALRLDKFPLGSFPHYFKKDHPILSHKTSTEQL